MNNNRQSISKMYLISVILFMLVLPSTCTVVEYFRAFDHPLTAGIVGKWFLFWGVGLRLLTAGLKQVINPAFTAESIFHLQDKASFVVVRELGFANICIGSGAILSLFMPQWRIAAAFTGGLYFGIAGLIHVIKKPVSPNEWLALVSDIFIAGLMAMYIISCWQ